MNSKPRVKGRAANRTAGAVGQKVVVSILIANYNARDLLRQCLESIFENKCHRPFEVLVVDDCSEDDSYEMVQVHFPQVRVFRNERNMHYAASNNRMFRLASGAYLYLLNSDTIMLPEAIDKMIDFLGQNPRVGCVGSKLLNEDGSIQASVKTLPNIRSALFGARSWIYRLIPNNPFSQRELLHLTQEMTKPFPAGYVSSASCMLRREVVDAVGDLDSRLSYHVDADYCARIWRAGWEVFYFPDSVVTHLDHKGGTLVSPLRRFKSVLEFHRGTWIYFQKHQMKSYWHPMTFIVVTGLFLRFAVSLLLQQSKELVNYLRSVASTG